MCAQLSLKITKTEILRVLVLSYNVSAKQALLGGVIPVDSIAGLFNTLLGDDFTASLNLMEEDKCPSLIDEDNGFFSMLGLNL